MRFRNERVVPALMLTAGLCALYPAASVAAEEDEEPEAGWTGSAEVTAVMTSGNAEAESFGARAELNREWDRSAVEIESTALRAESTTTRRFGVGSPGGFRVVDESTTELTAENYLLRGRFDRSITDRFFWFAGAGWERNTFAGFDNRYSVVTGAGHHWIDAEDHLFSTTYGVTYTSQDEVVGTTESFTGIRLGYKYRRALTETATFGSTLLIDGNLDETSDYRLEATNWIQVSMSERLALKVSLQALYDAEPSLVALDLFDEAGDPTGETALTPLDELDLLWTAALVVKF